MDLKGITIEWAENPLATKVILDDYGRLRLRLGMAMDKLYEEAARVELAKRDADLKWLDHSESGKEAESYINDWAPRHEQDLLDTHCGDCTCVPMSCSKCHVEGYLDISTTDGLGSHAGHHVQSAYSKCKTLAEAIQWLQYEPIVASWVGYESHVPRWRAERHEAAVWLEKYQQEHFSK